MQPAIFSRRLLLFVIQLVFFSFTATVIAQDYQWAFTSGKAHHTQPAALRKDDHGDLYLATYTDSLSIPLYTQIEKRSAGQQLAWQKQIDGNAVITDLEINAANHPVITGYFKADISIDGNTLSSVPGENSGFIFETDETGMLLWVHALNPLNTRFRPVDLYIASDGFMYLTAETAGTGGYCSFHKLDAGGNIIKNEFTFNLDNQRFSHIIADTAGNVYLSGTCGNLAVFDTIAANPAFSYQNFLIKYDSSFKAKWMIAKNYITFDHNNKLCTDEKNLYWAFDDFTNNLDTVKIVKANYNGEVLSTINAPVENAFLPAIDYSVDRSGNSTFFLQAFVRMYLYRYDSLFNIVWQDTLMTSTSGNPLHNSLVCYDSSFYMQGLYLAPSLSLNNFTLANPNTGISYPSDVFVYKWGYFQVIPVTLLNFDAVQKEEKVLLQWRTENEINADKFIIEKSDDGVHFRKIGSVDAKNRNSNEYQFQDNVAGYPYEIVYYRLKQTDRDARYKLSGVVKLKLNTLSHIRIFPDPVTTTLNVEIHALSPQNVEISVHDLNGKLIMKNSRKIIGGNNFIYINPRQLASGNYILSIQGTTVRESRYFTKQ